MPPVASVVFLGFYSVGIKNFPWVSPWDDLTPIMTVAIAVLRPYLFIRSVLLCTRCLANWKCREASLGYLTQAIGLALAVAILHFGAHAITQGYELLPD